MLVHFLSRARSTAQRAGDGGGLTRRIRRLAGKEKGAANGKLTRKRYEKEMRRLQTEI